VPRDTWGKPQPKPAKRQRASTPAARDEVYGHVHAPGVRCWGCDGLRPFAWRRLHGHHLVPRSKGGDDVAANIAPLCGYCHSALHGAATGTRRAVAVALRGRLPAAQVAYVEGKMGRAWLDRTYPPRA
jgi:5-methylcytosine-specific restriction endonuclease McrA